MTKVVINCQFGGFSLSEAAASKLGVPSNEEGYYLPPFGMTRDDPRLIAVVEEMGVKAAGGEYTSLQIKEVPKGVAWRIREYDGAESIEFCFHTMAENLRPELEGLGTPAALAMLRALDA